MIAVADDLAIRNLVAAYSDAVGRRDDAAWREAWLPDCVWAIRDQRVHGVDAAYALYSRAMDEYPVLFQTVFSGAVQQDPHGETTGVWHIFEIQRTREGQERLAIGRYEDTYARTSDGWRFAQRHFTLTYRAEVSAGLTDPPAPGAPMQSATGVGDSNAAAFGAVDPAAEIAIRHTVAAYADAVTRRDIPRWRDTWADDGIWSFAGTEFAGKEVQGRDACATFMNETLGWFPRLLQTVLSGQVFADSDGAVRGVWYILEVQHRGADDERLVVGRYEDAYRNQDGRWVFAERRYRRLYGGPVMPGMLGLTL